MRVVAVYNIKGGVGKTACAVNLAYLAAAQGARTLVWDLDPQGAATYCFRVKPKRRGRLRKLVESKRKLEALIVGTDFEQLDLLRAHFSFRNLDLALDGTAKPLKQLARMVQPLRANYDYLFFDCPPGITLTSESVFHAADALLIPTIPSTFSLRTLAQLRGYLARKGPAALQVLPFFSMVDARKSLHRQISARKDEPGSEFLSSLIPYASEVEQMGVKRAPLLTYAGSSRAAHAYRALWQELEAALRAPSG